MNTEEYYHIGDSVYNHSGQLVLTISFAPFGDRHKWARKVAEWMNNDHMATLKSHEAHNFSKANELATQEDFEEGEDLLDFSERSSSYMSLKKAETPEEEEPVLWTPSL